MPVSVCAAGDDHRFELSDNAARLSLTLSGFEGHEGVSEVPLQRKELQTVITLLEMIAPLLSSVPNHQMSDAISDGLPPFNASSNPDWEWLVRANELLKAALCQLDHSGRCCLDHSGRCCLITAVDVASLMCYLHWFDCPLPTSMLAAWMAEMLRGKTADELLVILGARDRGLSDLDKHTAIHGPLLAVPAMTAAAVDAPPPLDHSVSVALDRDIPDEPNAIACLDRCEASTLRQLKAVSASWRRRVFEALGKNQALLPSFKKLAAGLDPRAALLLPGCACFVNEDFITYDLSNGRERFPVTINALLDYSGQRFCGALPTSVESEAFVYDAGPLLAPTKVQVFRTHHPLNGMGFGLRTLQDVSKGALVIVYWGKYSVHIPGANLPPRYPQSCYTMTLAATDALPGFHIEPLKKGNAARWINHSNVTPNLVLRPVPGYTHDRKGHPLPLMGLYASRNLVCGEELLFDYTQSVGFSGGQAAATNGETGGLKPLPPITPNKQPELLRGLSGGKLYAAGWLADEQPLVHGWVPFGSDTHTERTLPGSLVLEGDEGYYLPPQPLPDVDAPWTNSTWDTSEIGWWRGPVGHNKPGLKYWPPYLVLMPERA